MIAKDLMAKCEALGVTLAPGDHGALQVRPPGVLTDELTRLFKVHKVAILNFLVGPPPRGCYTCQQRRYWQHAETSRWICATCHPPAYVELVDAWQRRPRPRCPGWECTCGHG